MTRETMDTANGTIAVGGLVRVIVPAEKLGEGFRKLAGQVGTVETLGEPGTPVVGMAFVRFEGREAPAAFRGVELAPVDRCPENPDRGPHELSDSLCPTCLEYDCDVDGHADPTEVNLCVWCLEYDVVEVPLELAAAR